MKVLIIFTIIFVIALSSQIQTQQIYLGCYIDNIQRDLPNYQGEVNKVETCIEKCKSNGSRYAGLQYECWCGNEYGTYGRAKESDCSLNCLTNSSQKCGGYWRNNIYVAIPGPTTSYYDQSTRLGCFEDQTYRDLNNYAGNGFSIEKCLEQCYTSGYKYAGIQYSSECWCDNKYGKYGQVSDNECNLSCTEGEGTCGGYWKNEVYTLSSNIELEEGCGLAFTQCYFKGQSFKFCTEKQQLGKIFKSFKIPEGHTALVFNENFENYYEFDYSLDCVHKGYEGILLKE